jgi:hypothetical protein
MKTKHNVKFNLLFIFCCFFQIFNSFEFRDLAEFWIVLKKKIDRSFIISHLQAVIFLNKLHFYNMQKGILVKIKVS